MSLDLIPRNFFSFPSFNLPSFWDEDELANLPTNQGGLSVYEDKENVFVEAAVPGLDPKEVEVTVQDDYLWVRGETKNEEKDKDKKYYRKATKSFSYRVAVPGNVDSTVEPEASYKHGVMVVKFKKATKALPKKIQVRTE